MKANGTVALLTDFGTSDWYVASMKAAALVANPHLDFVDITHDISPGSIAEGAFVLTRCFNDFPAGTTFLVVIDPGVGMSREPIVVSAGDYYFVGPNNGVLFPAISQLRIHHQIRIESNEWMGKKRSATFHGRDIFAPAGGQIASGAPIQNAGKHAEELVPFEFPAPKKVGDHLQGNILYFDRFGNGLTNFVTAHVESKRLLGLRVEETLFPLASTFGEVEAGTPVSYWGSSGFLEVAIRDGNAKKECNMNRESTVGLVYS